MEQSPKYTLNQVDWKKVGVGALVAVAGVLLTYVQEFIGSVDFGEWTPVVTALNAVVVNIARKFLSGY